MMRGNWKERTKKKIQVRYTENRKGTPIVLSYTPAEDTRNCPTSNVLAQNRSGGGINVLGKGRRP